MNAGSARLLKGEGFNLLGYVTWRGLIVFAVLLATSIFVIVQIVYRARFRQVYLELEKEEADSISEDIVRRLGPMGLMSQNWGADPQSISAQRDIQHKLDNFDIVEFSFIDLDGKVITLMGDEKAHRAGEWNEGLNSALKGVWAARWENDSAWTLVKNPDESGIIESYVPVLSDGKVVAVAHVRRDLSKIGLRSHALIPQLVLLATFISGMMFLALWLVIRKADRIIRQQRLQIAQIALQLEKRNKFLEAYDRQKDEFLSVCSHDVRSPLTGILAGCLLLLRGAKGALTDMQREVIERNQRSAQAVITLTDELLDLARIDAGQEALQITCFDMGGVIRESIAQHQSLAESRGVVFHLAAPRDELMIEADRLKILRVCNNLISNAVKYSAAGCISVRYFAENNWVNLSVTDNGPGISPEEQTKLFDRFTALSRHKTSRTEGTGLGLSITRALLELHGGNISVRSEVGRGATFNVRLPLSVKTVVHDEEALYAR